jgi:hypothetical protein
MECGGGRLGTRSQLTLRRPTGERQPPWCIHPCEREVSAAGGPDVLGLLGFTWVNGRWQRELGRHETYAAAMTVRPAGYRSACSDRGWSAEVLDRRFSLLTPVMCQLLEELER